MEIKCQICGNEWNYLGKQEYWATCPRCLRKANIKKQEEIKNGDRKNPARMS